MSVDHVVEVLRSGITTGLMIAAPVLICALVLGLAISLLQAVTQLQDRTMSEIPKLVGMFLVILFTFPWIIDRVVRFATELYQDIPLNL